MDFHLPDLQAPRISGVTYGMLGGLIAAIAIFAKLSQGSNRLHAIPAVGSSSWFGSWRTGFKFLMNARNVIQEGYERYKPEPFKVAEPNCWTVILSGREHLEELAKASNEFSFLEAINDRIQVEYLFGPEVHYNPYHVQIVSLRLGRNLEALFPSLRDEIVASLTEHLDLRDNEWKSVLALGVAQKVICRASNRVFVGLPLCRDPDWIDLNIQCTIDAVVGGVTIGLFPKFLRPIATRFFTRLPKCIRRGMKLLGPIIEERQKCLNEYGIEWNDKPNDFLSWLMDEAEDPELTIERLTARMLVVNFTAVHSTSGLFTRALFYLAANPQYIQPLREEIEGIVEEDGWSKAAVDKMRRVDSFLKECMRIDGILTTLSRKALKDFTFSDGTFIPKGTLIAAATLSLHHDENIYENPGIFEPFRFVRMREDGDEPRHRFTSTSVEYLPFGHGRNACPGRFFAASELKLMLAHIVVTYDVKLEDNTKFPSTLHIGAFSSPDPHAKVAFRKRVD